MTIAEALKRFRIDFALSQREVASKLGMVPQAYCRYENGQFVPKADAIIKLAQEYDVSTDYLLGLSDVPRPPETATLVNAINDAKKILNDALDGRKE